MNFFDPRQWFKPRVQEDTRQEVTAAQLEHSGYQQYQDSDFYVKYDDQGKLISMYAEHGHASKKEDRRYVRLQ